MRQLISRVAQLGLLAAVALAFVVFANPAAAQDGKALYAQKGCPACHGPDGATTLQPTYPKLAGQNADYIVAQLKSFKAQERKSAQAALMNPMAATLSDSEMVAIAKFLQSLK